MKLQSTWGKVAYAMELINQKALIPFNPITRRLMSFGIKGKTLDIVMLPFILTLPGAIVYLSGFAYDFAFKRSDLVDQGNIAEWYMNKVKEEAKSTEPNFIDMDDVPLTERHPRNDS